MGAADAGTGTASRRAGLEGAGTVEEDLPFSWRHGNGRCGGAACARSGRRTARSREDGRRLQTRQRDGSDGAFSAAGEGAGMGAGRGLLRGVFGRSGCAVSPRVAWCGVDTPRAAEERRTGAGSVRVRVRCGGAEEAAEGYAQVRLNSIWRSSGAEDWPLLAPPPLPFPICPWAIAARIGTRLTTLTNRAWAACLEMGRPKT